MIPDIFSGSGTLYTSTVIKTRFRVFLRVADCCFFASIFVVLGRIYVVFICLVYVEGLRFA